MNYELLFKNIKRFIEIQYGETVDESMEHYIWDMIRETLLDKEY